MANKWLRKSNKCEGVVSSVEAQASDLLRGLARPANPGESVKVAIGRAARRAGLSFGRARRIWYGLAVIRGAELDHLRRTAGQTVTEDSDASTAELLRELRAAQRIIAVLLETMDGPNRT